MNSILALPSLDNQLANLDTEIKQLAEKLKEKKALKKAIALKKKAAIKASAKLETALMNVTSAFEELGESAEELKAIVSNKIKEYFPSTSNLVGFPKKENKSNEYFEYQNTSNKFVTTYFNIAKGKTQCTYVGNNNKNRLESVGANLIKMLPGISFQVRKSKRLETTYELKLNGLDDNAIGWLTQFDFSQDFYSQLVCRLESPQVLQELKLSENNWVASPGATIKSNYHDCLCHIVKTDNFGTGIAINEVGTEFLIHLDDWHLTPEFQSDAQLIYEAIKLSKTKKELEAVRNSKQIDRKLVGFVWAHMPKEDKEIVLSICKKEEVQTAS